MADAVKKTRDPARRAAGRAMFVSGLLFGLLVLLGITGMASVTLFYIEFDAGTSHESFEGVVISIVRFCDGWLSDGTRLHLLRHIHGIGSYLAIVLTGWAAVELWSAAGVIRIHVNQEVRQNARFMRPLAIFGAVALEGAIIVQLLAGSATRGALDDMRVPAPLDRPASAGESDRVIESLSKLSADNAAQSRDEVVVQVHMRELNYPLGFGAILMLIAVVLARRAAIVLDAEPKPALDVSKDKPKSV
ncbi:hypothetical protein BAC2_00742 [uncultured bacterium]|nr:hypothetical protein BAC2_00742 [uncultured bacterium]